jgi:hypothetical protein
MYTFIVCLMLLLPNGLQPEYVRKSVDIGRPCYPVFMVCSKGIKYECQHGGWQYSASGDSCQHNQ